MNKITPKTTETPKTKQRCKWVRYKYPSRPEVFEAFAKWMAFPKPLRETRTQGEFAKLHEVSPDTLSDYKKKSKFWEEVKEQKHKIQMEIIDRRMLNQIFKEQEERGDN